MKTRNGFVSNSSSSSFIVGCKSKNTTVKLTIEVDLADYGEVIKTKEELLEYYKRDYGYDSEEDILAEEYTADNYQVMLSEIEKGNKVIVGSFASDSGDAIEQFLCDNGLNDIESGDINVIQSDAGY